MKKLDPHDSMLLCDSFTQVSGHFWARVCGCFTSPRANSSRESCLDDSAAGRLEASKVKAEGSKYNSIMSNQQLFEPPPSTLTCWTCSDEQQLQASTVIMAASSDVSPAAPSLYFHMYCTAGSTPADIFKDPKHIANRSFTDMGDPDMASPQHVCGSPSSPQLSGPPAGGIIISALDEAMRSHRHKSMEQLSGGTNCIGSARVESSAEESSFFLSPNRGIILRAPVPPAADTPKTVPPLSICGMHPVPKLPSNQQQHMSPGSPNGLASPKLALSGGHMHHGRGGSLSQLSLPFSSGHCYGGGGGSSAGLCMVGAAVLPLSPQHAPSASRRSDLGNLAHLVQLCTRGRPLNVAMAEVKAMRQSIERGMIPADGGFYAQPIVGRDGSSGSGRRKYGSLASSYNNSAQLQYAAFMSQAAARSGSFDLMASGGRGLRPPRIPHQPPLTPPSLPVNALIIGDEGSGTMMDRAIMDLSTKPIADTLRRVESSPPLSPPTFHIQILEAAPSK